MSEQEVQTKNENPETSQPQLTPQEMEKKEEEKLKAKYAIPTANGGRIGGHSAFLQKGYRKDRNISTLETTKWRNKRWVVFSPNPLPKQLDHNL